MEAVRSRIKANVKRNPRLAQQFADFRLMRDLGQVATVLEQIIDILV